MNSSRVTYVALLRGINVGGSKMLKMDDLKKVFEEMGFQNIKTFLATGNVVFEAKETNIATLTKTIVEKLQKKFGFEINILIREMKDIQKLIDKNPFKNIVVKPETRLYVTFLTDKLKINFRIPYENSEKDLKILSVTDTEVCTAIILSPGRGTTEMMGFLEKNFGKKITTRNWNTIQKLADL